MSDHSSNNEIELKRQQAKRQHDLTNAVRVLRFALEAIQEGYKFDDDKAQAKMASMDKALRCLETELLLHSD